MMYDGYGWGGMGFGGVGMLLFWGLIVVVVVLLAWSFVGRSSGARESGSAKTALDIIRERYAKGEIDKEEFEQKRHDLGS